MYVRIQPFFEGKRQEWVHTYAPTIEAELSIKSSGHCRSVLI